MHNPAPAPCGPAAAASNEAVPSRIEDYALLSDNHSAALVARNGSIDWLTFPRFDSPACFAALLGTEDNGHWQITPACPVRRTERRYREGTLVLETVFHTDEGTVALIDCMPMRDDTRLDLARLVEGRSGAVPMRVHFTARMDYGSIIPWVRHTEGGLRVVAGPDALLLCSPVDLHAVEWSHQGEFTVGPGDQVPFDLAWHPSHEPVPEGIDVADAIERTALWWTDWSCRCRRVGEWDDVVQDSMVVLKGLTYAPTGGIVAAPTTSLPETIGGTRNWDYRYCWLRDATFTLTSLMDGGYQDEAVAWRDWLLRALAGRPDQVQIMYGVRGERRLWEHELDWLPGYEGSQPVRIGNDAHRQFQLDVFGEVLDALHQARSFPGEIEDLVGWSMERQLVDVVAERWNQPDDGIWEVRGGRRHFTHSKVMAWVAVDRAVKSAETYHLDAPLDRWKQLRAEIHADVLAHGLDDRGVFVQSYGSKALDASLLLIPIVGFLPPDDPRVVATVAAIETELSIDGFVYRYSPDATDDGVGGQEGAFLMCTLWLADVYSLQGRDTDARAAFQRVLRLRNDVGLLAEQYDPVAKRMLGNFPQAFSHTALVATAMTLGTSHLGAAHRQET
ncbi:MAG: glycoside hydrolase 15-related protein [Acidimicrobiales bacterium]|nr:glycoside hydrolase 15-related protein [Acidimicrobiales bacterium]